MQLWTSFFRNMKMYFRSLHCSICNEYLSDYIERRNTYRKYKGIENSSLELKVKEHFHEIFLNGNQSIPITTMSNGDLYLLEGLTIDNAIHHTWVCNDCIRKIICNYALRNQAPFSWYCVLLCNVVFYNIILVIMW